MTGSRRKVVIIGGGLSGLSAAFYVRKYYREAGVQPDIVLLEKENVLGGKIETLQREGFVIEKGPDSFLARKTAMVELAQELKLDHELVTTNPNAKKTYILQKGKLHPMPAGLVLGIPTELMPFLQSGLVSFSGKMRAMLDFVLPPRRSQEDESLGELIERRLGTEVLENMTEPLLAGIYAGDMRKISLQATFPQFGEVERKYGSLIRGMTTGRKPVETHTGTKKSAFLTFRNGLQSLVQALIQELHDVEQRTGTAAAAIQESGVPGAPRYVVQLESGEALQADDIFVTVQDFAAAGLLRPHVDVAPLEDVNYVSVANVVLAFAKKDIITEYDGSGFLVPRKEGRNITACTWTSTKWLHTSPDDKVLLRCYVGRSGDEQNVELPDKALTELVLKDLREIMGITANPLFSEITRLRRSMPQYPVGHPARIAGLRSELGQKLPGVYAFGAGYDAIGLPDCIRQAKEAAGAAAAGLQNQPELEPAVR
ncbi:MULTISPECIES: protoporphyrinogen oxidase [unclassified Paenibacillus]|uniref:protoporphyrinogen oxidase n=1 Tax=unclassified Paenibacillus TaxID=185978 RepID=UPI002406D369|nr:MULTISPECIES: protoporphyrinogen oxidase [unclassified Paenibacillus]MDF9842202.1 oxygen-dependent protoporphyrinogen oxidase [Paenibacillus sp. PastF-2]MDF9848921.1 oxygen-dependent protoporphyrinogen oxidase [Paenibacillus sp. PastM-2]MDF9855491.1 oxygen-dependent protoporphyrinogen oxidase [Paenibacillus sp. PastF-1]MDH6480633.1 oxygen-dependent protoporphyrinogen oxidase [Paenibacillus sp. PastH-2]MDH6508185.1 oxygen-dependent protoporphyrinogen oxidase [Paenibacillus sp. PastM-3]